MREVPKYYAHEAPLDAFAVKDRVRGLLVSAMIFISVTEKAIADLVNIVDTVWKLMSGCRNHIAVKLLGFILRSVFIVVAVDCFLLLRVTMSVAVDSVFSPPGVIVFVTLLIFSVTRRHHVGHGGCREAGCIAVTFGSSTGSGTHQTGNDILRCA